jgi:hypothetical protein
MQLYFHIMLTMLCDGVEDSRQKVKGNFGECP